MVKLKALLASRKFWALVAALVTIGCGYFTGTVTAPVAIQSAVAALAAYMVGTGLETPAPPAAPAS